MDKETKGQNKNIKESVWKRIWNGLLNHFFKTFFIIFIINVVLLFFRKSIPEYILIVSFFVLVFYVILYSIYRLRISITRLLHHEIKFKEIITSYISSVIFIIILMTILYWGVVLMGAGYLKYGSCVDNVDITREVISNDSLRVKDIPQYTYYSATTFFTLGSGDICPMGDAKLLTVINALIGNAFTVLILAIAITNYASNKENGKK